MPQHNDLDIARVLHEIAPSASWSLYGESYDDLVWRCEDPKPSLQTIEDAWSRIRENVLYMPIRAERDGLLAASDWTQVADAPVDSAAWAKYRQALRDLPAKISDPTGEVNWPKPPK